ncbi:MAG: Nif11-like leader peptide family natural product precursor [Cyanobacteria bacterium J06638_38]
MLNQIKALLKDFQLRQQIKQATTMAETISLIKSVGSKKGYQFSSDSLSQLLQDQLEPLSEADLLLVAGGILAPTNQECDPTRAGSVCIC